MYTGVQQGYYHHDDTRDDICRYISWRIAEKTRTQAKKLLDDIIAAFNEKSHSI